MSVAVQTLCGFCEKPLVPGADDTMQVVIGFEKRRVGGGTNMLHLRTPLGRWAHDTCVHDQKPRQQTMRRAREMKLDLSRLFRSAS